MLFRKNKTISEKWNEIDMKTNLFIIGTIILLAQCRPNLDKSEIPSISYLLYKQNKNTNTLSFAYPSQSYSFLVNVPIATQSPVASTVFDSYSVSPALPLGLIFDTKTGQISGTPTTASPSSSYTITATNSQGSTTFTISITVTNSPPTGLAFTGSPFSWTENQSITVTPVVVGVVTNCISTPNLPTGLTISSSCVISGIPTIVQGITTYTITASNIYGSISVAVDIAILASPIKRIFVTNSGYTPNVAFNNLATADNICNTDSAKPAGLGTYAAMIAIPLLRVACTLPNCPGGNGEHIGWIFQANKNYYQADGITLIGTTDANGLMPPTFVNPATGNAKYWTGINVDWTTAVANNCVNWTSNAGGIYGNCGGSGSGPNTSPGNLLNSWGGTVACNAPQQLLCIEQ